MNNLSTMPMIITEPRNDFRPWRTMLGFKIWLPDTRFGAFFILVDRK